MLIRRNAAPRGLPTLRMVPSFTSPLLSGSEVLRRNSCVTAMPIDANASDVRSQAKNVRSVAKGPRNVSVNYHEYV